MWMVILGRWILDVYLGKYLLLLAQELLDIAINTTRIF
jgi:hypothetical protein